MGQLSGGVLMKHLFAIAVLVALGAGPGVAAAQNPTERCKNHFILGSPCGLQRPVTPDMLAFVSERDGNSEIYVVNVDGTGLRRLTNDAGQDVDPAWSPDGRRIAFSSDRAGSWDIYVMDADGSNVVRRTQAGAWNSSPAWSTDGTKIAFSSLRDGQYGLYVMSVDGDWGNPTRVGFDRGWNTHPAWSPDGNRIAFVSDWRAFDMVYDVYVMKTDGSEITTLFEGPFFFVDGPIFYFQPAWSPEGGRIAVVVCPYAWADCYPDASIAIANADGSGLKTLVKTSGFARPTWSPDGSTIAFSSRPCSACEGELRYVTADGSRSGVIFANGHDPAWRPYASFSNGSNPTARP
jgi:Tol biopolymer transport system component